LVVKKSGPVNVGSLTKPMSPIESPVGDVVNDTSTVCISGCISGELFAVFRHIQISVVLGV